ncbi:MAG: hypothetical protein GPJ54_03500 [Candidatus Heimdallarchaeota archaeon]|nr:hypothetical protein [Candidatus Heimdallarchaeota archaeon]
MSSHNELQNELHNECQNEFVSNVNFSSYRTHKPLIMDLNIMRIPIKEHSFDNLEDYFRLKDKIQCTYENATESSQKFIIPKLESLKKKYHPSCCNGDFANRDPFDKSHTHFEFKILQLLDTLKCYLDETIKVPRRVLEIKLLENE